MIKCNVERPDLKDIGFFKSAYGRVFQIAIIKCKKKREKYIFFQSK